MLSKLIAVVGNSGVGKTTFAQQLCRASGLECAFEQHIERPFHTSFAQDLRRYALANQVDFLLFRAEQEQPSAGPARALWWVAAWIRTFSSSLATFIAKAS